MAPAPAPLARLLGLASQQLADRMLEVVHAAGFPDQRRAHGAVMSHVPPEGIHLSELARRAGMTKQAMSELVADLQRLGYLSRQSDPNDRRLQVIHFSERGWAAIHTALRAFQEQEDELAARLGARRIQQLRETLEAILD